VLSKIKRLLMDMMPRALAGRLRAWRVRQLIRSYPAHVVEHVYGTGLLRVWLPDPLAAGWYDRDWPDLPEIACLRSFGLRAAARVFDIGAHQGVVAAMLAREVGESGKVIAVEANPHNAIAAIKNRDLNGMKQIEVLQAAVSDRVGTLVFNEGLNGQIDDGSRAGGCISVDTITIDGLADRFGAPDVLFVDIEGAECLALAGAPRVLASSADWFVEVHVGHGLEKLNGSVEQVLAYFPTNRFSLLARAENDLEFRPFTLNDPLLRDRFFLLALTKDAQASSIGISSPT
jgi:FkbM family methyltransferase